jgi:hypothetical protein
MLATGRGQRRWGFDGDEDGDGDGDLGEGEPCAGEALLKASAQQHLQRSHHAVAKTL